MDFHELGFEITRSMGLILGLVLGELAKPTDDEVDVTFTRYAEPFRTLPRANPRPKSSLSAKLLC